MINRIIQFEDSDLAEINTLLSQLSLNIPPLDNKILTEKLSNSQFFLFSIKENECGGLIAIASFSINNILSCKKGFIEDVIVRTDHRGQGIGKLLIQHIIDLAISLKINKIELTSRPERLEANLMYQNLGFVKRDTNFYQLKIS